jgi:hypothetical protein
MHFRLAEGMVMPVGNAVDAIVLVFRDDVLELDRLAHFLVELSTGFPHATIKCVVDEAQSETVQLALGRHYHQFRQRPAPHALPELRSPEQHRRDLGQATYALEMHVGE